MLQVPITENRTSALRKDSRADVTAKGVDLSSGGQQAHQKNAGQCSSNTGFVMGGNKSSTKGDMTILPQNHPSCCIALTSIQTIHSL